MRYRDSLFWATRRLRIPSVP